MAKGNFDSRTVMSRRAALTAIGFGLMMSTSPACKPRATADGPVPAAVDGGADAPGAVSAPAGPVVFEGEIDMKTNAGSTSRQYKVKGDKARSEAVEAYGDIPGTLSSELAAVGAGTRDLLVARMARCLLGIPCAASFDSGSRTSRPTRRSSLPVARAGSSLRKHTFVWSYFVQVWFP